jgi:hypothetical protein
VTTCGVAGFDFANDWNCWTHPDKGGVFQIWSAEGGGVDQMFMDDAMQDEPWEHTVSTRAPPRGGRQISARDG